MMSSTEELIEAVRQHQVPNDTAHPDYMKGSYKDEIRAKIASTIQFKDGRQSASQCEYALPCSALRLSYSALPCVSMCDPHSLHTPTQPPHSLIQPHTVNTASTQLHITLKVPRSPNTVPHSPHTAPYNLAKSQTQPNTAPHPSQYILTQPHTAPHSSHTALRPTQSDVIVLFCAVAHACPAGVVVVVAPASVAADAVVVVAVHELANHVLVQLQPHLVEEVRLGCLRAELEGVLGDLELDVRPQQLLAHLGGPHPRQAANQRLAAEPTNTAP
ncbi:hypothetical protein E2C01_064514 [Portunus trituberculatus]|uniref:Uncharacterized protein n=1 Tax=Portunus trituberculatus TaxID=210409 RepID=A0A5B7HGC4_PORTR|nr:hypothetical protein [Portunus trituberculatus]